MIQNFAMSTTPVRMTERGDDDSSMRPLTSPRCSSENSFQELTPLSPTSSSSPCALAPILSSHRISPPSMAYDCSNSLTDTDRACAVGRNTEVEWCLSPSVEQLAQQANEQNPQNIIHAVRERASEQYKSTKKRMQKELHPKAEEALGVTDKTIMKKLKKKKDNQASAVASRERSTFMVKTLEQELHRQITDSHTLGAAYLAINRNLRCLITCISNYCIEPPDRSPGGNYNTADNNGNLGILHSERYESNNEGMVCSSPSNNIHSENIFESTLVGLPSSDEDQLLVTAARGVENEYDALLNSCPVVAEESTTTTSFIRSVQDPSNLIATTATENDDDDNGSLAISSCMMNDTLTNKLDPATYPDWEYFSTSTSSTTEVQQGMLQLKNEHSDINLSA